MSHNSHKESNLILDRCIFEDFHVFTKTQIKMGYMKKKELAHYLVQYHKYIQDVRDPHLFIFLRASKESLADRIKRRGRDYEQNISEKYLETLNTFYDEFFDQVRAFFKNSSVIVVNTDQKSQDSVLAEVQIKLRAFRFVEE